MSSWLIILLFGLASIAVGVLAIWLTGWLVGAKRATFMRALAVGLTMAAIQGAQAFGMMFTKDRQLLFLVIGASGLVVSTAALLALSMLIMKARFWQSCVIWVGFIGAGLLWSFLTLPPFKRDYVEAFFIPSKTCPRP